MEIELRLDMSEAEKDWNAFKKRIIEGISDEDIIGTAAYNLEDLKSYFNSAGTGSI
jgi:hypothetical protein